MTEKVALIALDQALEITGSVPVRPKVETVRLRDSLGRVLAADVRSPIDSPPFDKSTMDGFAVTAVEAAPKLRIAQTVAAGQTPAAALGAGETARIMTGAMLPPGASRVIRREYVHEEDGFIHVRRSETEDNVVRRGANLQAGSVLLSPKVILPADVGILAASGIDTLPVAIPPRVIVLCTGPEIRQPGQPLGAGEIYDSNGPQLHAQLAAMGCSANVRSGIEDRPESVAAAMAEARNAGDVILLTGGVSVGDFDYVPSCLRDAGAEILFHRVSVKPGKPTLFARLGDQFYFGLPGNPVSTFVIFEVFVKAFLYRMMGLDWTPVLGRGRLARDVRRSAIDRTEFLPVRLSQGRVEIMDYRGSAHVNGLAGANGLLRVEIGVAGVPKGTEVDVRPI